MITLPEKLTAAKLAEIAKINPAVAKEVKDLMTSKRTRKVNYWVHPAPWKCNLAEGAKYTFYAPNGNQLSTQMVGERTLGARNDGINYHVAENTPPMPAGTWAVEFEYFLGEPCIDLHQVTAPALPTCRTKYREVRGIWAKQKEAIMKNQQDEIASIKPAAFKSLEELICEEENIDPPPTVEHAGEDYVAEWNRQFVWLRHSDTAPALPA